MDSRQGMVQSERSAVATRQTHSCGVRASWGKAASQRHSQGFATRIGGRGSGRSEVRRDQRGSEHLSRRDSLQEQPPASAAGSAGGTACNGAVAYTGGSGRDGFLGIPSGSLALLVSASAGGWPEV